MQTQKQKKVCSNISFLRIKYKDIISVQCDNICNVCISKHAEKAEYNKINWCHGFILTIYQFFYDIKNRML